MDGMQTNFCGKKKYSKEMSNALEKFASTPLKISAFSKRMTIHDFALYIVNHKSAFAESTIKEALYILAVKND
jgi:hypothetical protein